MWNEQDTRIGGQGRQFPTTAWSDVLALKDTDDPEYRSRMDRLLRLYWKPIYVYIRNSWRKSPDDAKDLTQTFFAYLLERKYLSSLEAGQGSFRGYLKVVLKHFLIDCKRTEEVHRRERAFPGLVLEGSDLEKLQQDFREDVPEVAYDRQWLRCLLESAIESLRGALLDEGKAVYFEVFRRYCLEPQQLQARSVALLHEQPVDSPTYGEVASALGIKESDVRNYLTLCRTKLLRILWEQVRDTVADEEETVRELYAVLTQ